ncbi:unnamed protein product [Porites evermanni]|uniref:Uncharacterized protein n=1 Tax=Porites evermanni TaxID=104178 RepID=A0ABN8LMI1_9CNID|nr:unnamed protein product [Porites evermanni]
MAVPALLAGGKTTALGGIGAVANYGTKKAFHSLSKRGTRTIGSEDLEEDDENNLAIAPMQQFISNIASIQKGIKRPATPKTPEIKQSPITPDITVTCYTSQIL